MQKSAEPSSGGFTLSRFGLYSAMEVQPAFLRAASEIFDASFSFN